jgi:hypothetical protein
MFKEKKSPQFWLLVKEKYPSLSDKAVKILLPFVTTYLGETGFSAVAVMKTKHRPLLTTERSYNDTASKMLCKYKTKLAYRQSRQK